MPFDLTQRVVLVTGASSGIGAAVATEAARRGATVGICARRGARLARVLEECRGGAPDSRMWVVDLADPEQVDRLASEAEEAFGRIDVLVNNAGIPKRRLVTALTADEVDQVMLVNYRAPVRLSLALLPGMLRRRQGHIINVSSVAAVLSSPGEAAYNASKAALTVFTETAAVDLWATGVGVHLIHPGVVETGLFDLPDNDDLANPVDPIPVDEAARAVLGALDTGRLTTYIPDYFEDLAKEKANDVEGFIAGMAAWVQAERNSEELA
ncbi:MAG: hypothetical protein JJLCMIEE_01712 [Acidimicrobiales bacterium]|nr:MAG: SDR family oxidoreductase [Actinomycetota bacterium]MBV6508647.1 hypothetical protein [Acidimicrobiales bacterium]RIK08091.1 MAG: short-chain dehydrogenase [Acidobacteriota bacterium]